MALFLACPPPRVQKARRLDTDLDPAEPSGSELPSYLMNWAEKTWR
jgi:hypothetical protein